MDIVLLGSSYTSRIGRDGKTYVIAHSKADKNAELSTGKDRGSYFSITERT